MLVEKINNVFRISVMAKIINNLIRNVQFEKKERFQNLSYSGYKKISRIRWKSSNYSFFNRRSLCNR